MTPTGETVLAFRLSNESGASVEILTYGGIVRSLCVPALAGSAADVVLGFDQLEPYLKGHPYFGAIVGRIAGRVSGGRLLAGGRPWSVACNDPPNHLHGGKRGFDKRVWIPEVLHRDDGAPSLRLRHFSPDGEEGYPGNLEVAVTYTLAADNSLIFETEASADQETPLSLAQHSYFNLAGEGSGGVQGHEVRIFAGDFVPTDDAMTLLDRRERVWGTSADLKRQRPLGEVLPQLARSHGDLYLLRAPEEQPPVLPTLAATVFEPRSGRILVVSTTETCLQFYTGSGLDGTLVGKAGRPYGRHAGLCLECEGYPNATTVPGFGDILVRPGTPQRRTTVYQFPRPA